MFSAFLLYRAVEPLTKEHFFWQFSDVDTNTNCYQRFLAELSPAYPHSLNILQLDNGLFDKASRLSVPNNLILLFQLPYSPLAQSNSTVVGVSQT